jgi:hypothetical protein
VKLSDFNLWTKKYNGWFIIITTLAAIFFWVIVPPIHMFLISLGSEMPQHYRFYAAQRSWIELHPLICLTLAMTYYVISLKFLNGLARRSINVIYASYIGLHVLSILLAIIYVPDWSIFE